jgi:hypothetical protein
MDNQFTPGPWDIEEVSGGHNFSIYELETSIHLANVGDDSEFQGNGVLSGNKILANAHLIAAAPDLLEALNCMLSTFNHIGGINHNAKWAATHKARAAINKALNK